ncbi:MAG: thioredoxin [Pseudomonadota bacterium]
MDTPTTIDVTDSSFDEDVLKAKTPVVVDFWAEWCGPCKQISPALEQIAAEMEGKITIAKVNVDENPNTPSRFAVRNLPTLILFKDGELADKKVGADTKGKISMWIESAL